MELGVSADECLIVQEWQLQAFNGIKSLGHTFYVSGVLGVLESKGLVSTLEHVGHFRLLCELLVGFVVAIYIYIY